jgi:hypothetical protein
MKSILVHRRLSGKLYQQQEKKTYCGRHLLMAIFIFIYFHNSNNQAQPIAPARTQNHFVTALERLASLLLKENQALRLL